MNLLNIAANFSHFVAILGLNKPFFVSFSNSKMNSNWKWFILAILWGFLVWVLGRTFFYTPNFFWDIFEDFERFLKFVVILCSSTIQCHNGHLRPLFGYFYVIFMPFLMPILATLLFGTLSNSTTAFSTRQLALLPFGTCLLAPH